MKRILNVLALGLILVSCAPKQQAEAPADLLSKDIVINVLIDLYKAEATVSTQHLPKDEAMNAYIALQDNIYTKNNVDSAAFNKSYNFYLKNRVEEAAEIQKTVVERLKEEKEELSKNQTNNGLIEE